jgi:hypothetical protein
LPLPQTLIKTLAVRQQYAISKPLYAKREQLLAKIPNFWPLVLEQAPMDIDEYIQPSDSAILLSSLKSLSVSRFELDADEKHGDPRNIAIRFEFAENEHFEDSVLEKKFWWRQSKDGFTGLVSEPVEIRWKNGKDLTDGLLGLVKAVYDEQKNKPKPTDKKAKVELTEKQKALKEKIDQTGMGGVSFFAWFGYIGEYVTAEESKAAIEEEKEERRKRKAGEEVKKDDEDEEMDEDDEDEEEEEDDLDIFPMGDAVAMAIADDLWPGALKYFSKFLVAFLGQQILIANNATVQAQEQDMMSELDFESDDEDEDDEMEDSVPHHKKKKACAHGCAH